MANEAPSGAGRKPAQPKVNVLRCRGDGCGALMPYEETDAGYFLGQAIELAETDGAKRFFPCPRCGGRQLVEEFVLDGKKRTRICGFEPGP